MNLNDIDFCALHNLLIETGGGRGTKHMKHVFSDLSIAQLYYDVSPLCWLDLFHLLFHYKLIYWREILTTGYFVSCKRVPLLAGLRCLAFMAQSFCS